MTFNLDINEIRVQAEINGLRLTTNTGDNQLLTNVSITEIREVVTKNYILVKEHYHNKTTDKLAQTDIEKVSLKVVLRYFYMYQLWRTMYKREKNRDLTFIKKDFEHPYTLDTIISYFKSAYPKQYADKCEIMLNMSSDKFKKYEKERQEFYDMW